MVPYAQGIPGTDMLLGDLVLVQYPPGETAGPERRLLAPRCPLEADQDARRFLPNASAPRLPRPGHCPEMNWLGAGDRQ